MTKLTRYNSFENLKANQKQSSDKKDLNQSLALKKFLLVLQRKLTKTININKA